MTSYMPSHCEYRMENNTINISSSEARIQPVFGGGRKKSGSGLLLIYVLLYENVYTYHNNAHEKVQIGLIYFRI